MVILSVAKFYYGAIERPLEMGTTKVTLVLYHLYMSYSCFLGMLA